MAAPFCTAASTSISTAGNPNHGGVHVKKPLASSLCLRLLENGLTAIVANEEIKPGYGISSHLEHAVRTVDSVHVAIFSPRYAGSYWCLAKAPIIPVFYPVTPAELRWTQGNYAQSPQTHEKKLRHNSNTTEDWRNALSEVRNNSGFELETCNGEELELESADKVIKPDGNGEKARLAPGRISNRFGLQAERF